MPLGDDMPSSSTDFSSCKMLGLGCVGFDYFCLLICFKLLLSSLLSWGFSPWLIRLAGRLGAEVMCHCHAYVDPDSCWVAMLDFASTQLHGLGVYGIGFAPGKFGQVRACGLGS